MFLPQPGYDSPRLISSAHATHHRAELQLRITRRRLIRAAARSRTKDNRRGRCLHRGLTAWTTPGTGRAPRASRQSPYERPYPLPLPGPLPAGRAACSRFVQVRPLYQPQPRAATTLFPLLYRPAWICRGVWWGGRQVTERGEGAGGRISCGASVGPPRPTSPADQAGREGSPADAASGRSAVARILLLLEYGAGFVHCVLPAAGDTAVLCLRFNP